jgi:hypothetical protein
MPRIDHRMTTETAVPYDVRLVLEILVSEINTLRTQAGLPVRTTAQIRTAVRNWIKANPRNA